MGVTEIVKLWESQSVFSQIRVLSEARKRKIKSQIRFYPDIEHWKEALEAFTSSSFCRDVWKPTFDDFLNENKRVKALEGTYADRSRVVKASPEDDSIQLADKIWKAVSKFGYTDPSGAKQFVGDFGARVIQDNGGWKNICETANRSNPGIFKAQLRKSILSLMGVSNA